MCRPCATAPPGPPGTKEQTATLLLGRCPPQLLVCWPVSSFSSTPLAMCWEYQGTSGSATLEELRYLSYLQVARAGEHQTSHESANRKWSEDSSGSFTVAVLLITSPVKQGETGTDNGFVPRLCFRFECVGSLGSLSKTPMALVTDFLFHLIVKSAVMMRCHDGLICWMKAFTVVPLNCDLSN